jgi:hypothetical protein
MGNFESFFIYHHCQREVPACKLSGEYIKMFSPTFSTLFLYLQRSVVSVFIASFDIQSVCVLPLRCICLFSAVLTVDNDCASRTFHQLVFLMGVCCVLCKSGNEPLWCQYYVPYQDILPVIRVFYLPTDAQENFFKNNIKIYIKTAPTCFGSITIIRERTIRAC